VENQLKKSFFLQNMETKTVKEELPDGRETTPPSPGDQLISAASTGSSRRAKSKLEEQIGR